MGTGQHLPALAVPGSSQTPLFLICLLHAAHTRSSCPGSCTPRPFSRFCLARRCELSHRRWDKDVEEEDWVEERKRAQKRGRWDCDRLSEAGTAFLKGVGCSTWHDGPQPLAQTAGLGQGAECSHHPLPNSSPACLAGLAERKEEAWWRQSWRPKFRRRSGS